MSRGGGWIKAGFTNASSRAMIVHTRRFSDHGADGTGYREDCIGRDGCVVLQCDIPLCKDQGLEIPGGENQMENQQKVRKSPFN